jgi:hypothetical protein
MKRNEEVEVLLEEVVSPHLQLLRPGRMATEAPQTNQAIRISGKVRLGISANLISKAVGARLLQVDLHHIADGNRSRIATSRACRNIAVPYECVERIALAPLSGMAMCWKEQVPIPPPSSWTCIVHSLANALPRIWPGGQIYTAP